MGKLFETALVEQCAPTLAGIKPANLLCLLSQSFLIYIYRKSWIQKILMERSCKDFLIQTGYGNTDNMKAMLNTLTDRLCMKEEFPHEGQGINTK